jgi:hypothetical protein
MHKLAVLLLISAAALTADDAGFLKWWDHFKAAVAKGEGNAVAEGAEFPMDWEYGSVRKIPAKAALTDRFDSYFTADIRKAVATQQPARLPNGMYCITWKARGNEYSLYIKSIGGSYALDSLSEGPP